MNYIEHVVLIALDKNILKPLMFRLKLRNTNLPFTFIFGPCNLAFHHRGLISQGCELGFLFVCVSK